MHKQSATDEDEVTRKFGSLIMILYIVNNKLCRHETDNKVFAKTANKHTKPDQIFQRLMREL